MTNIFLTGETGVGKSTVIQKVLALLPPLTCGGFRTVSAVGPNALNVYLEKAWEETPHDTAHLVGSRFGAGRFAAYPKVFDAAGTSILAHPPADSALILMDELGVMETEALIFRRAVMELLDGPLPVLGVIKPKYTDFLDAVRAHSRSQIFEVSAQNRDALPAQLAELLRAALPRL